MNIFFVLGPNMACLFLLKICYKLFNFVVIHLKLNDVLWFNQNTFEKYNTVERHCDSIRANKTYQIYIYIHI